MADKKQKETSYYTSSEKNLVPSKKKSESEKLYGKVKEKPTYKGKVKFKNLPKEKDPFWQLGKSKERITAGDLIRSVTGRGGLNKGGLIKGKPKLAKKGWK
jgi:hypothetical protein